MQVKLYTQENGNWTVYVKRTRRDENPSRVASNVLQEDLQEVTAKLIQEVGGEEPLTLPGF